jgi:transposase
VREQLRRQALDARNAIWSILQPEGLKRPKLAGPAFQALVAQALGDGTLAPMLRPLVEAAEHLDRQVAGLDKLIAARAKASTARKRLMQVPGVGPKLAFRLHKELGISSPKALAEAARRGPRSCPAGGSAKLG